MAKYIFVTGGVVSSLGKGLVTACLGRLLRARGYAVSIIKIDPYLNVDAGTMSPFEHGEVFVLDDGGEAAAPAGQVKGDGSALSFVRVLGAGHMVPMDQPAAALKMITAFTRGEKIASTGTSISKKGGGAAAAVA